MARVVAVWAKRAPERALALGGAPDWARVPAWSRGSRRGTAPARLSRSSRLGRGVAVGWLTVAQPRRADHGRRAAGPREAAVEKAADGRSRRGRRGCVRVRRGVGECSGCPRRQGRKRGAGQVAAQGGGRGRERVRVRIAGRCGGEAARGRWPSGTAAGPRRERRVPSDPATGAEGERRGACSRAVQGIGRQGVMKRVGEEARTCSPARRRMGTTWSRRGGSGEVAPAGGVGRRRGRAAIQFWIGKGARTGRRATGSRRRWRGGA